MYAILFESQIPVDGMRFNWCVNTFCNFDRALLGPVDPEERYHLFPTLRIAENAREHLMRQWSETTNYTIFKI